MSEPGEDGRLTYGLLFEVYAVLDAHGYKRGADDVGVHADALVALLRLTEAYEGRGGHGPNG